MSVYLIQCLCPQRHCIVAIVYEADQPSEENLEAFKATVASMLAAKAIDPWCGICKSREWVYETGKTRYRTLEEAKGPLAEAEAASAATREFIRQSRN